MDRVGERERKVFLGVARQEEGSFTTWTWEKA